MVVISELVVGLTVVFVTLLLIQHWSGQKGKKRQFPEVPKMPLLSSLWVLVRHRGNLYKSLEHSAKLGPINSFQLLSQKVILVNDFNLTKQMFQMPVFCARSPDDQWCFHTKGSYGIINTEGSVWEEQRKFTRAHLKRLGFGTKGMQAFIDQEVESVMEELSQDVGKLVPSNKWFNLRIVNALWMILTGHRLTAVSNKICQSSLQLFSLLSQSFTPPEAATWMLPISVYRLMALSRFIPGVMPALTKLMAVRDNLHSYFEELVAERLKVISENPVQDSTDFVEAYLAETRKYTGKDGTCSSFAGDEGIKNLLGIMADFFVAGGHTTSLTLSWALFYLIRYPEIQEKIFRELETVVGTERKPLLEDRPSCPYTEAFIHEVLRVAPANLSSLPHVVAEDTVFGGYFFEKGTMILPNIVAVNNQKDLWGDPENFRPERFLTQENVFQKTEHLMTFSIGRRKCLGEQLAKDNLFLYISAICQRFRLRKDPGVSDLRVASNGSGFYGPKVFNILVQDRLKESTASM